MTGEDVVNVRDFGAVGNGSADDTAAIDAAFAASWVPNQTRSVYFPDGQFMYNGDGLNGRSVLIEGAGPGRTNIYLGAGKYLTDYDGLQSRIILKNFTLHNGAGAYRNSWTSNNVAGQFVVEDCAFYLQTECVFQHESSDMPFWKFNRCNFQMENTDTTIAIALSGLTDGVEITNCTFDKQRVAIKMRQGGNNASIHHCEFIQFTADRNAGPAISVWVVPHTTWVNSGGGLDISNNRFGNENIAAGDIRIAYADELSGDSNGVQYPDLENASTGYITGHSIASNDFYEHSASIPVVFSTTPNVRTLSMTDNYFAGAPTYMLEYLTPVTSDDRLAINQFSGNRAYEAANGKIYKLSNSYGRLYNHDPVGMFPSGNVVAAQGNGSPGAYRELLSDAIGSFTIVAGRWVKDSDDEDALGGSDAATFTCNHASSDMYAELPKLTPGVPVWIEFDVANPADGNALTSINASIQHWTGAADMWSREVPVPTVAEGWVSYAFNFTPNVEGTSNPLFTFNNTAAGGDLGSIKVGRVRVYHGHYPQTGGARPSVAAAATDASSTQTLANDLRTQLIGLGIIQA